jgi:hypothetical protein
VSEAIARGRRAPTVLLRRANGNAVRTVASSITNFDWMKTEVQNCSHFVLPPGQKTLSIPSELRLSGLRGFQHSHKIKLRHEANLEQPSNMSEYWKSTPKYWCKHCKTFVRDTKVDRQNHDATPKHQGNLKRFLRDLHRGHEKEEKDKERAKAEVARLNGVVSGTGHGESSSSSGFGRGPTPSIPKPQATASQRKQQLAQLAEMGISIPDEFRGDMAMAGEWQVTSERIIDPGEAGEKKPEAIGFGVRKRIVPDDEEEAEAAETKKRRWGATYRTQPGDDEADLDALLSKAMGPPKLASTGTNIKQESQEATGDIKSIIKTEPGVDEANQKWSIKREPPDGEVKLPIPLAMSDIKDESDPAAGSVVFKKRKAKPIRQK